MNTPQPTTPARVKVTKQPPFVEDFAYSTLRFLDDELPQQGLDNDHLLAIGFLLVHADELGTMYANPMFVVKADQPSPEFYREAKRAQLTWFRWLKDAIFFSASGLKREMRVEKHPLLRQLKFTGIMIAGGKHLLPGAWDPQNRTPPEPVDLIGLRFGRLIVEARLPHSEWRCRCDCGEENTVRTKHLIHGRIKSSYCQILWMSGRQAAAVLGLRPSMN